MEQVASHLHAESAVSIASSLASTSRSGLSSTT